jgi:hypothetical protein
MEAGETDSITGTLSGIPFHVMGSKEAPYFMTMMTTYGILDRRGNETDRRLGTEENQRRTKFHYPEVFGNHFKH